MRSRTRGVLRWAIGTIVFGAALLLLDLSLYHFWHLRRARTAPAEWHLQIALGAGAAAALLTAIGARLLRRWGKPTQKRSDGSIT